MRSFAAALKSAAPALVLAVTLSAMPAGAQHMNHGAGHPQAVLGDLKVEHPWARATTSQAKAAAVFLEVFNDGVTADRLVGGNTPVAEKVEIHNHIMDDGVARMRKVDGGLALPPVESVKLAPGGLHLMLVGLKRPLSDGETFPLTLTFEKAGTLAVTVMVHKVGAGPGDMKHDHGAHHGSSPSATPPATKPSGHNH